MNDTQNPQNILNNALGGMGGTETTPTVTAPETPPTNTPSDGNLL